MTLRPYVTTSYGSLLRKTSVATYEPKYVAGLGWTFGSRTSSFTYDSPYGGDSVTYPYVAGRMATASNEVATIAFGYDQDGTPKERDEWFTPLGSTRYGASIATGNDGRAVQAQFTSLGSPTITHSLQYDSFGRPVKVVAGNSGATALWATTTTAVDGAGAYDALGRIADSRGYVSSNGGAVTTKRTYGAYSGQMLGQETKLGTTDLYRVGSMGYLGEKLTEMTDQGTATTYAWAYDTGGRLVTATATANTSSGLTQNYSHSFAFSPVWNLTTANVAWNGTSTTSQGYTYSGTDQATQAPGGYTPSYALTYDGMGNIVDRRVPGSPTAAETLNYTAEGYLRSIVRGGSTDEVLFYDALGNLAYRRSGTNLWFYAGEHATITATTTCTTDPCAPTAGTVKVNVHVLLAGARIATVRTTPGQTADQAFGNVLYFHRDRQGSVVATTTTGGVLGAQYRYGPYGELDRYAGNEATAGSDLGYTGGLRLSGGLIHLRARVYDPSFRRFLQADVVDPLRYTYTNGDPTNYIDPSGRMAVYIDGLYRGSNGMSFDQAVGSFGTGGGWCQGNFWTCAEWHRYDQPTTAWMAMAYRYSDEYRSIWAMAAAFADQYDPSGTAGSPKVNSTFSPTRAAPSTWVTVANPFGTGVPPLITSPFAYSRGSPAGPHLAVDLAAGFGTMVFAPNYAGDVNGSVVSTNPGVLQPPNGVSRDASGRSTAGGVTIKYDGVQFLYYHLEPLVKAGQVVPGGSLLGITNNSGRYTAPHLHFGVRVQGGGGWLSINPAASFGPWCSP